MDIRRITHEVMREKLGAVNQTVMGVPGGPQQAQGTGQPLAEIGGYAGSGLVLGKRPATDGPIPGEINPMVADDTTINAKIGEYILSPEVVDALGGAKKLDKSVKGIKKRIGLPPETGPKRHDQPDSLGRMDKPGLPERGIAGLADGGSNDGSLHWNPEFIDHVKDNWNELLGPGHPRAKLARQTTGIPTQNTNTFSVPGSFEHIQALKENKTPKLIETSSLSPIISSSPRPVNQRLLTPIATTKPVADTVDTQPTTPPPANPTGYGNITIGARGGEGTRLAPGSFYNTSGPATGGFSRNEELRQKDVTLVNDREAYAAQVQSQRQVAERQQQAQESRKQLGLDMQSAIADISAGGTFGQRIEARHRADALAKQLGLQNESDKTDTHRYGAELGLEGHKYAADAGIRQQEISGQAHIKAAEIGEMGRIANANYKSAQDSDSENKKDHKERTSGLVKEWGKLNLPPEYAAKLPEYASIVAESEDPKGSVFLLGSNSPERSHLALPRAYEPVYREWRAKGYSHNDAAAAVAAAAKKAGVGRDIPNFQRYGTLNSARNNTLGEQG